MSNTKPDTIALAVDGMEPSLLETWIQEGKLPNITSLRSEGAYGTADCSSLSSAVQWVSHFTGVSTDEHGVTGFLKDGKKRAAGDHAPNARELINLTDIPVKTYPELLAEAGHKVGLINPLPLWPPLELSNGFCVSGMLSPPTTDRWVYPPELKTDLDDLGYRIDIRYGDRPYGFVDDDLFDEIKLETLYEDIFDVLDARIEFTKYAVEHYQLDYLYSLLKSIDVIQHCFWAHMIDDEQTYGSAILESYQRVDELVGWIQKETDANILVFSDHGFKSRQSYPSGLHSIATAVSNRIPLPSVIKQLYFALFESSVNIDDGGVSISSTTGVHANPAVWMISGSDITEHEQLNINFEDIPPTLLALLNEPIPNAYTGCPIPAISKEWDVTDRSLSVRRRSVIEEEEVISERLHNLGYAEMVDKE